MTARCSGRWSVRARSSVPHIVFVSAAVAVFAQAAGATPVKVTPLVVETHVHAAGPRVFELTSLARVSDAGSAVMTVRGGTRHMRGTLTLTGRRGTLRLRWTSDRPTRGGSVAGSWWVSDATGAYAGRIGSGDFAADPNFRSARFRGMLVVAV